MPKEGFEEKCGNEQEAEQGQEALLRANSVGISDVVDGPQERIGRNQLGLHHQSDDGNDRGQSQQVDEAVGKHRCHQAPRNALFTPVQKFIYPPKDGSRGGGMARIGHGSGI